MRAVKHSSCCVEAYNKVLNKRTEHVECNLFLNKEISHTLMSLMNVSLMSKHIRLDKSIDFPTKKVTALLGLVIN